MKRQFRVLIPVMMACVSLCGCDGSKTSKDYGSYYKGYNLELTGGKLANELQKMCFEKHTYWVNYASVNSYFARKTDQSGNVTRNSAEAVEDGGEKNQYFYTGIQKTGTGTREHVWPCANSGGLWPHNGNYLNNLTETQYIGGGSDLYHVRTCDTKVNSARGNSKFVDFDDPEFSGIKSQVESYPRSGGGWKLQLFGLDGNDEFANKCEPDDHMKGDVARVVAYVWLHYFERGATPDGYALNKATNTKFTFKSLTGALSLTNIMGYDDVNRCKEKLKEWNKLDAPSGIEKLRNNTVQKIQGNRNPFVDYPELMDKVF
jgi:endonuclease I